MVQATGEDEAGDRTITRSSSVCMLWDGQTALRCGTLQECIDDAKRRGLFVPDVDAGLFALREGSDIQVYPLGQCLRWFSAEQLGDRTDVSTDEIST